MPGWLAGFLAFLGRLLSAWWGAARRRRPPPPAAPPAGWLPGGRRRGCCWALRCCASCRVYGHGRIGAPFARLAIITMPDSHSNTRGLLQPQSIPKPHAEPQLQVVPEPEPEPQPQSTIADPATKAGSAGPDDEEEELLWAESTQKFRGWIFGAVRECVVYPSFPSEMDEAAEAICRWRLRFRGGTEKESWATWLRIMKSGRCVKELNEVIPVVAWARRQVGAIDTKSVGKVEILDLCSGFGYLAMFLRCARGSNSHWHAGLRVRAYQQCMLCVCVRARVRACVRACVRWRRQRNAVPRNHGMYHLGGQAVAAAQR
jgi:hypothetical protein